MVKTKNSFRKSMWLRLKRWHHNFWTWYKGIFVGRPWYIKLLSGVCSFIVFVLIYAFAVNINFLWLFGKSPSLHSIMHPKTNNASYVYSADGQLLCKYYDENRTPVKFEEINPQFFHALIDTEDERFYSHHGVDFGGLFAAAKDYVIHHRARGASTITQQLVKNMFKVRTEYSTGLLGHIPGVRMLIMKTKEWILATEIEMFYGKKEILTMYANTVDFGNNAFGIKTAARTYYNTSPDSLNIGQCATLVGLLKATSSYNPKRNPKRSMERRNVVLNNMVIHGNLDSNIFARIKDEPTPLNMNIETPDQGRALYFREAINIEMKDWCEANGVDFYTDGLKIYTTLDTRMQQYAEEAVRDQMYEVQQMFDHRWGSGPCWIDEEYNEIPNFVENVASTTDYFKQLKTKYPNNADSVWFYMKKPHPMKIFEYQRDSRGEIVAGYKTETMSSLDSVNHLLHFMHAGFVAMDPRTGYVKAWVGDIDYKTWKYDKVKSMRQPGSTFKLFVYAAAMEKGLSPCDRRLDDYIKMDVYNEDKHEMEVYSPHNANGYFSGANMTLREAFVRSINSVAVRTGVEVGMENVENTAYAMGIKSPLRPASAKEAKPSLALGSMDVNLLELVNAYGTVANYGMEHAPVLVTKIIRVNPDGSESEIYNYKNEWEETRAITARTAFLMQHMLMAGLTDAGGTSQPLGWWVDPYSSSTDFGGKTGTSNNHSDAWFVAVTPNLVVGAWVGGEYRCIHLTSTQGQGSRTALPICGKFFEKVWRDRDLRPLVTAKFIPIEIPQEAYDCDPQPSVQDDVRESQSHYGTDTVMTEEGLMQSLQIEPVEPGEEQGTTDAPAATPGNSNNAAGNHRNSNRHNGGSGNSNHQQPTPPPSPSTATSTENRVKNSFDK